MDETTNNPLQPQIPETSGMPQPAIPAYSPTMAEATEYPVSGSQPAAGTTVEVTATEYASLAVPVAVAEPAGSSIPSGMPAGDGSVQERGISIISSEATVLGDIITEGHIDVIGKVRGNIAAQGDVAVHGQVRGNIDGEKIGLYNSRVKGNLSAGQGVIVNNTSIIDGDVTTKNIIFDGKVRGNIAAESVVVLRSNSYCLGDVTAASLAVEPGAVINGNVRTLIEGDLEAPFEEII